MYMYGLFYKRRVRNFDKFCAILVPPEDMGGSEISAYVLQADDGKGKDLWVIEQPDLIVTENLQSIRTLSARNVWTHSGSGMVEERLLPYIGHVGT